MRGDADALTVNWLMIEIVNAAGGVTYRNSFITDLEVGPDTVVDLAACGRARWKIENESFNAGRRLLSGSGVMKSPWLGSEQSARGKISACWF